MSNSTLSCVSCGAELAGNQVKDCSARCKGRRKARERRKRAIGAPYEDQGRAHGRLGEYQRGCRCAECRAAKSESMRDYSRRRREAGKPNQAAEYRRKKRETEGRVAHCGWCGKQISNRANSNVGAGGPTGYCRTCRLSVPGWKLRAEINPRILRLEELAAKAARGTRGSGVIVNGPCAWCGEEFTARNGVYCSSQCSDRASWSRKSSWKFSISPKRRLALYERDGWECQLCGRPVDSSLDVSDVWAATLDHIVPQSAAGVTDHSDENLRLSHRLCNSVRGDDEFVTVREIRERTGEAWLELGLTA